MPYLSTCTWLRQVVCGCIILVVSSSAAAKNVKEDTDAITHTKNEKVILATNINSAFTADIPELLRSDDVQPQIKCIFHHLNRPYSVHIMPWRRTYQDIKNNRIDGFFTAIAMRQVDPHAVLSAPLLLENWYWFWRSDTVAPESWREGYSLGSILGSQQESWLEEAGYKIDVTANNLPHLIKQLKYKRIDVLLADLDHFHQAIKELHLEAGQFQSRFFRYVPLGVYFNEAFLNRNPEFLSEFNEQITECTTAHFQVSDYEREHIRELLFRKIERWKRLPGLEQLLLNAGREAVADNTTSLADMDAEWRAAFLRNDIGYPLRVVNQEISTKLREIKNESQGLITEIIITDSRGANVAISDMTSDYWQGDEKKFTEAFGKPSNSVYFSDITYDESTQLFQVQLSMPLNSDVAEKPLGVMVLGVNVEKALSLSN